MSEETKDVVTTIRIPNELDMALSSVARVMTRTRSHIMWKGIEKYIRELQEDIADYKAALEALQSNEAKTTLNELKERYGLGN